MILRSLFLVFAICLRAGFTANTQRQELTISECAAKLGECDESKGRPVCGTDEHTYPTRCHLLRVQCSGHQVSVKYRGPCKACSEARDYALKHRGKDPPKFIPRCKSDGTYALIQCLMNGGCWCSDITGTPIENTTVRTGKPRCREFSKANIRRSPSRNSGGNKKRPCSQDDRATFNNNLINVFQSEFIRMGQFQRDMSNHKAMEAFTPPSDADVLDWKFSQLDVNHNQMLDKIEYRELKKLVKRAVKPRRCGRAFGKFCDVDSDERLSRLEWNSCLAKDGVNHSYEENESNAADDDDSSSQHVDYDDNDNDYEDVDDEDHLRLINTFGSSTKLPSIYILNSKSETSPKESDTESDCLADQAAALEEQKHGNSLLYVPDCTPDGRYQRVQCYNSTPYCWCVNEDTGKNIPGTSVKDRRPQCDSIYTVARTMKGCPDDRKIVFLKDLKEFLKTKIITGSHAGVNTTKWNSEDERIATLSFVILDKNKNKAWERKEWKIFRELVTNVKTLRKCGRKMPRYCDVNSDKKITLTEWLGCLQTHRVDVNTQNDAKQQSPTSTTNDSSSSKPPKLTGSNPLEQYLKD